MVRKSLMNKAVREAPGTTLHIAGRMGYIAKPAQSNPIGLGSNS